MFPSGRGVHGRSDRQHTGRRPTAACRQALRAAPALTSASRQRRHAIVRAVAVLEEVPRLHEIALGVLEVQRAVASLMLDRPAGRRAQLA
jgi:hypothetical protein